MDSREVGTAVMSEVCPPWGPLPDTPRGPRPPALGCCLLAPPRPPRLQAAGGRHLEPPWDGNGLEGASSLKASSGLLLSPGMPCLSPTPGWPLSPPWGAAPYPRRGDLHELRLPGTVRGSPSPTTALRHPPLYRRPVFLRVRAPS